MARRRTRVKSFRLSPEISGLKSNALGLSMVGLLLVADTTLETGSPRDCPDLTRHRLAPTSAAILFPATGRRSEAPRRQDPVARRIQPASWHRRRDHCCTRMEGSTMRSKTRLILSLS